MNYSSEPGNWTKILTNSVINAVSASADLRSIVVAGQGLNISRDGGDNWSNSFPLKNIMTSVSCSDNFSKIYALQKNDTSLYSIHKSTNFGETFSIATSSFVKANYIQCNAHCNSIVLSTAEGVYCVQTR